MMLHEVMRDFLTSTSVGVLRVFYDKIPQASKGLAGKIPCVVFSRSNTRRGVSYCAADPIVCTRLQLDSYATTYDETRHLALTVRTACLNHQPGELGNSSPAMYVKTFMLVNEFDLLDSEPGLHRVSQWWDVWHNEEE